MTKGRFETFREVVRPRLVSYGAGALLLLGGYDAICNQFGTPRLGQLLGIGWAAVPAWGYFVAFEALMIYGLFEYVRTLGPVAGAPSDVAGVARAPEPGELGQRRPPAPPEPDISLKEVAIRVAKVLGAGQAGQINLEIADKVHLRNITVWARFGRGPIQRLAEEDLQHATFGFPRDEVLLPGFGEAVPYTSVQFVRTEVEAVWPEVSADE